MTASITRQQGMLLGGAITLVMFMEWVLVPVPKPVRETRGREEWSLPSVAKPQTEKALETLEKAAPWGTVAPVDAHSAAAQKTWRLIGVVRAGSDRSILIQEGQEPERHLAVGGLLPGGSKIVEIRDDAFVVIDKGKRRVVEIYQQEPLTL